MLTYQALRPGQRRQWAELANLPEVRLGVRVRMGTGKPKKLGKYEVLDIVGRGSIGVVYKAIDPGIGRLVAIKMMTVGFAEDPRLLTRFYREAQAAGKLQHPNIVPIYDLGDQDGNPYMVMEFLKGESLGSIISSGRSLSLEQKLKIVIQICNALAYAHQRGVVHRGIKPANAIVLQDLNVKILDFGIARIGNEGVTRSDQIMGRLRYMSPEQINASNVDSRTDIFSVGVLLYQLLAYAFPFDGEDAAAILLKIIHDPPPPLSAYLRGYPAELDTILARALAKTREERYSTADDLAFDLARVLEELKREKVSAYLRSIDGLMVNSQWNQAKEQVFELLKIDPQNTHGNDLLRTIQQRMQAQQRGEQAQALRLQAEQAAARDEWGNALRFLDRAVELDTGNKDLQRLRGSVAERKARAEKLADLLQRAESARDCGELEEAQNATTEALALDKDNSEAKTLNAIITREIAEQTRLKQVKNHLDEARKHVASRSFTAALDVLKKAETLSPNAPGLRELENLAVSGLEQEKCRKQIELFNAEIEDALNRDDFALACSKATEGLQLFPEERSLLKHKGLAEKQRHASEKRAYVEEQIAAAHRLLNSADPEQSLLPLEEALKKYPEEKALISMLSVARESLHRLRMERYKAECSKRAKDALRRKAYDEAIQILSEGCKEIESSELDDLLQFAQEEASNLATRKKIDAVTNQAHQLISAHEYQRAIDLLESVLKDLSDPELIIILGDARRQLEELNQQIKEAIAKAEHLLRHDRYGEAVRFLEGRCEQYGDSPALTTFLQQARNQLARVQKFSVTKETVRDAIAVDDFDGASTILRGFYAQFGDTLDARLLQQEVETARSRVATAAMEKALSDARVLLMVRSVEPAEGILDSVSKWSNYVSPELRERFESLQALALDSKAKRAASGWAQKSNHARMAEQVTASRVESSEHCAAIGLENDSTAAVSPLQLEAILGQVTQIAGRYPENERVQSAIDDLKQKLTVNIAALRKEGVSANVANLDANGSKETSTLRSPSRGERTGTRSETGI